MIRTKLKHLNNHWFHSINKPAWLVEQGFPLLFFTLTAVIFSWPLPRYFTTHLISSGGDARHNLWILWHVKEAVLGRQPFWDLPNLYYPAGASLLTHGIGPITGFLALPFWPWGPEAAYNGSVLLSLILTGYAMYLLARSLSLPREVALFAGLFLLAAPMHLAGLHGHISKAFMAGPPLVLLCFIRAMNPTGRYTWAAATGAALLLTAVHNGYQFVVTSLTLPFVTAILLWQHPYSQWQPLLKRLAATVLSIALLVGPWVLSIQLASAGTAVNVDANLESLIFQPDAIEFLLPNPGVSRFFGSTTWNFLRARSIEPTIESTVYLSWVGLALAALIAWKGNKQTRSWLLLSLGFVLFALGPRLQLLGRTHYTEYQLPILLPYALLTSLPGLDFMRAPGRFMMVGYTVWCLTISLGLALLLEWQPRWRRPLLLAATALLLIEFWPITWPLEALRPVPDWYQKLAADPEMYGVLDLPIKPTPDTWDIGYSSYYQMYQMTHHKGIASGYISRTYERHPLFPCIIPETVPPEPGVFVNDGPADCRQNLLFELAAANYRYVVWHKGQPDHLHYKPDAWGEQEAAALIAYLFDDQPPLVEDHLVRVYALPSVEEAAPTATLMLELGEGWYPWEESFRWASSPAILSVWAPEAQQAILEIVPDTLYVPNIILGTSGQLYVSLDGAPEHAYTAQQGQLITIPLSLQAGWQQVQLRLETGNFSPYLLMGSNDKRDLSFSVRSLRLRLPEQTPPEHHQ